MLHIRPVHVLTGLEAGKYQSCTHQDVVACCLYGQVRVAAYKDSRNLRQLKEKHNKHVLSTYNKAYAFFPKVSNRRCFPFL